MSAAEVQRAVNWLQRNWRLGRIDRPVGIERWADRLPAPRLGVFGTFLIFSGFVLESVERWMALFDVPIR